MGEGANRDEVHAAFSYRANGGKSYTTARFSPAAALHKLDRLSELVGRHVVKENDVGPGIRGLRCLLKGVGFNLHLQGRILLAGSSDGLGDLPAQGVNVVVLNEDHVEKSESMILSASAKDGVLLETTPAGRGFAGVEDFCIGAGHGVDELVRKSRYSGEALDEVKGDTFGGENRPSASTDREQFGPFPHTLPIFNQPGKLALGKRGFSQFNARENQGLAGDH